jgi:hypothetical protein
MSLIFSQFETSETSIIGGLTTVGGTNKYIYSKNSFNWEYKDFPLSFTLMDIAYGSGKFIVVNNSANNNILISNKTGLNWDIYSLPVNNPNLTMVSFANDRFIVDDFATDNSFYYSSNGVNWSTGVLPFPIRLKKVVYADNINLYIGISDQLTKSYIYSNNGINWNSGSLPVFGHWSDIIYDNNKFILLCNWPFQSLSSPTGYISTNGLNWSPLIFPGNDYYEIKHNKINNLYMIASNSLTGIAISNNGLNWSVTGTTGLFYNKIIQFKDKFIQHGSVSVNEDNLYIYSKLPYSFEFEESGNLYSPTSTWSNGVGNANIGNWFFNESSGIFRGIINTNQNGRTSIGNSGFFFAPSTGSATNYVDGYFNLINPLINGQGITLNANYSWNGGLRGIEFKPLTAGNSIFRIEHGNGDDRIFLRGSGFSDRVISNNGFQQALTYNIVYQKTGILFEARNYTNNSLIYSTGIPITLTIKQIHFYVGNILATPTQQLNYGIAINNLGINYKQKVPF